MLLSYGSNNKGELANFINEKKLARSQIVSIAYEQDRGMWSLLYWEDDPPVKFAQLLPAKTQDELKAEAFRRRAKAGEIQAPQFWYQVKHECQEIAFHMRVMFDLGHLPSVSEMTRLSELLCRIPQHEPFELREKLRQLTRDWKHNYEGKSGFSDQFNVGYQQALAEIRAWVEKNA